MHGFIQLERLRSFLRFDSLSFPPSLFRLSSLERFMSPPLSWLKFSFEGDLDLDLEYDDEEEYDLEYLLRRGGERE